MGKLWLANFNVSAVRCHKGFHVLNSARQASPCKHCKRPHARGQLIPPQSYSISKEKLMRNMGKYLKKIGINLQTI